MQSEPDTVQARCSLARCHHRGPPVTPNTFPSHPTKNEARLIAGLRWYRRYRLPIDPVTLRWAADPAEQCRIDIHDHNSLRGCANENQLTAGLAYSRLDRADDRVLDRDHRDTLEVVVLVYLDRRLRGGGERIA
jgi:hypothetical protein